MTPLDTRTKKPEIVHTRQDIAHSGGQKSVKTPKMSMGLSIHDTNKDAKGPPNVEGPPVHQRDCESVDLWTCLATERAFIGCLLLRWSMQTQAIKHCAQASNPLWLTDLTLREIFTAITETHAQGETVEPIAISQKLQTGDRIAPVTVTELMQIEASMNYSPTSYKQYASRLKQLHGKRVLAQRLRQAMQDLQHSEANQILKQICEQC